jgi:hypothetical protein
MTSRILSLAAMVLVLAGCQAMPYQPYARDVKKKPQTSGVIALKTEHRDEDRQKAEGMMQSNCGQLPVKVLEEGEVAVGQTTTGNATETKDQGSAGTQAGSLFGIPLMTGQKDPSKNTATSSTTTNVTEWQISYECTTPSKKASR